VDGALAASVFHSGSIDIRELKTYLYSAGIPVRPMADDPQREQA
jgi:cyclase